ncbi:hypothetical protein BUALT_Bualt07G0113900 [Buddleja alternifolia]|uniref:Uncharacterized protein n=1 Tax=Buddleja alternifolia TaxID=168488 RepID=A0AAV6XGH2_9LAMI|nr:hypothetical protein BUALT_Bualt07G0113900 [Buddleja alternifolia]
MAVENLQMSFWFLIIVLLPAVVFADCTCEEEEEDRNQKLALKYKLAAFASILVAGAIGVCIPVMGRTIAALSPDRSFFFIVKAFAAGVILSTGFIHVLPYFFENLTSPCIPASPWGDFPFTGFVAMVLLLEHSWLILTQRLIIGEGRRREAMALVMKRFLIMIIIMLHMDMLMDQFLHTSATTPTLRHRVISKVLELGIIVHSVIIGIALGASESPKTVKPLIAALTFHQFFEGIGLGECITQFNARAVAIMVLFFSLITPTGIAIGIGISKVYSEMSPTALIVEGIFNSASAGILIYMTLVDLLAANFMSPKMQKNGKLQLGANVSLLLGAGAMSLVAKWA